MYSHIYLVYGSTGWIGSQIVHILIDQNNIVHAGKARLEDRAALKAEIERYNPEFIINAAGVTGRPNVDWCEDHKQETIRANIIGALNLADVAFLYDIHMTNLGTGCIYEYDVHHPPYSGKGFTEEDVPNFHGSFYSHSKIMLDELLTYFPNVLNLRLRMPISADFNPRNFITKITRYDKVVNIPNSVSILDDLLPLIPEMAHKRLTGNYNFVNPGTITHNEILTLYQKYIDTKFTFKNFSIEEQDTILKARRSNNELDCSKLLKHFPDVPHVKQSIIKVFNIMKMKCK